MRDLKIKFINHACIQFFIDDQSFMVDPWFDGKVFNNSWSLLKSTKLDELELKSLKYIFISHEHPDHLNFDTLKKIYSINNDITCIFPFRKDETVKKVVEKIGFKFKFIKQNEEKFFLNDKDFVKYFSNKDEGDHTIAFSINEKVIINQNDDYTPSNIIQRINKEFSKIDILFTQFSLAGYYGNSDNPEMIKKNGHDFHLQRVVNYKKKFNAKMVVPFASYVYFCKNTNKYLNNFSVKLEEVLHALGNDVCQLVYYNDYIYLNEDFKLRNKKNLEKLKMTFDSKNHTYQTSDIIDDEELENVINKKLFNMTLSKKIFTFTDKLSFKSLFVGTYKLLSLSLPLFIEMPDKNRIIKINFLTNNVKVLNFDSTKNIDFKIPSEELLYMFKFPWGSDTANITATVDYYNKRSFYFFEYLLKYYHYQGAVFIK